MDCNQEMMLDHEGRITKAQESADSAHKRVNEIALLIKDFTVEMRESNKNISDVVYEIRTLTKEIGHLATTTDKHENDIADIKDNMETKDTVLKLYDQLQASNLEHKKGLDAVMDKLREQDKALEDHKLEPMKETYDNIKEFKRSLVKYLLGSLGVIILAFVMLYLGLK